MEAMFDLLDHNAAVKDVPGATDLIVTHKSASITFDNVWFGYSPNRPTLKGLSFTVPAGQTVAIVGPSGSGKTTLFRLMFRFVGYFIYLFILQTLFN
jgi:ATP-binding cassette subfamily B protein